MKPPSNTFISTLDSGRPLLADGAMGTLLYERGIHFDRCFDELNLSQPDLVAGIHREYLQAGAQLIKTNTFSANRYKLKQHGLEAGVDRINQAGVSLVRQAIAELGKEAFVAGDVGPLGVRLAPYGKVQPEHARLAFEEQILALSQAGADLVLIETMSDLREVHEAIQAVRQVEKKLSIELPVIASITFTRDDRTLLGDDPEKVARTLWQDGADLVGVNCSSGPAQLLRILKMMRQAVPEGRFSIMPNAGWPEQVNGRIMYPAGPEYFGEYALGFWQAGACLVGGCCGTSPRHIAAMRQVIDFELTRGIPGWDDFVGVRAGRIYTIHRNDLRVSSKTGPGEICYGSRD